MYRLPPGRVTVAEASKELLITQLTLRYFMDKDMEPYNKIGIVKRSRYKNQYIIYRSKLEEVKEKLGLKGQTNDNTQIRDGQENDRG